MEQGGGVHGVSVIHSSGTSGGVSVHPLHLAQDLPLVPGQNRAVIQHLLEHGSTLKLITGPLEVVPVTQEGREGVSDNMSIICTVQPTQPDHRRPGLHGTVLLNSTLSNTYVEQYY